MSNLVAFTPKYPQFPSDLLVKLRHRSGLSQSQVAQLLGLKSERMVLYWEGGYSLPPAARLRKLIELFLVKGGFLPGQEPAEIEQLWTVIKDFYDNTSGKDLPYPAFDRAWVVALVETSCRNKNKNPSGSSKEAIVSSGRGAEQELITSSSATPVKPDLRVSGEEASSQPIRTPNNLVRFQATTPLLGREKELQELEAHLVGPGGNLIVLAGPGGVGKTRLALEVASKVLFFFTDGVYFVNLAEITSTGQIGAAIGQALNLKGQGASPQEELERICQHLAGKKFLLLLDNFEQLAAHSTAVLNELLEVSKGGELKVLITSRIDLNLYGKQPYWLQPLALPGKSTQNLARLPVLIPEYFNCIT